MEACLSRHLRTNNSPFSAHHSRPHAPIGFVRIPAHQHNTPPMITFGSIHANLPSFSHRLSPQSSPPSLERPSALPAVSGDNDGDGTSWARTTAALATTTAAVILACVLAGGGGIRLKGVVGEPAAMAYMVPIVWDTSTKIPRGERAVQALLGTSQKEQSRHSLRRAKRSFYQLLQEKHPKYPELQEAARVLIKSEKEARKMIPELRLKFEELCDKKDQQNAVEIGLILAEMLIHEGKYEEAIGILHYDFFNATEKDFRPDLYRVAANLMCGNKEEAEIIWGDLQQKKEFMNVPDSKAGEGQRIPSFLLEFESALRKRQSENSAQLRKSWWKRCFGL